MYVEFMRTYKYNYICTYSFQIICNTYSYLPKKWTWFTWTCWLSQVPTISSTPVWLIFRRIKRSNMRSSNDLVFSSWNMKYSRSPLKKYLQKIKRFVFQPSSTAKANPPFWWLLDLHLENRNLNKIGTLYNIWPPPQLPETKPQPNFRESLNQQIVLEWWLISTPRGVATRHSSISYDYSFQPHWCPPNNSMARSV